MSLFRKVLIGTGIAIVVLALVGFMLPRSVHVERSISIDATPATVFTAVNGFTHFNKWSPWAALAPNAKYTFEGPAAGVGSRMSWVGDPATMGSGSQEIITSEPYGKVQANVDFGSQGKAVATYTITPEGQGTKVVWGFDTDLGSNPVSRYFGLMFDKMVGGDFERGLAGLKKYVESLPRG